MSVLNLEKLDDRLPVIIKQSKENGGFQKWDPPLTFPGICLAEKLSRFLTGEGIPIMLDFNKTLK